jgi:hypothetical protein
MKTSFRIETVFCDVLIFEMFVFAFAISAKVYKFFYYINL